MKKGNLAVKIDGGGGQDLYLYNVTYYNVKIGNFPGILMSSLKSRLYFIYLFFIYFILLFVGGGHIGYAEAGEINEKGTHEGTHQYTSCYKKNAICFQQNICK